MHLDRNCHCLPSQLVSTDEANCISRSEPTHPTQGHIACLNSFYFQGGGSDICAEGHMGNGTYFLWLLGAGNTKQELEAQVLAGIITKAFLKVHTGVTSQRGCLVQGEQSKLLF